MNTLGKHIAPTTYRCKRLYFKDLFHRPSDSRPGLRPRYRRASYNKNNELCTKVYSFFVPKSSDFCLKGRKGVGKLFLLDMLFQPVVAEGSLENSYGNEIHTGQHK